MTIKHPAPHHKASLSVLWQEAFDEPAEAFDLFYNTAFSSDRSMVCLEDDTAVAGLYWFDCLWGDKKVAYLYAVATKKSHRGQGLCNKLMQETHEELKKQNYHGAILVPAEDSLFSFYGKMGYVPCCPGAIPPEKILCHSSPSCHSEHSEESVSLLRCPASSLPSSGCVICRPRLLAQVASSAPGGAPIAPPNSQFSILNSQLDLTPISIEEYLTLQKDLLPPDAVLHTPIAYDYLKHFAEFYKTENGILCKIEEDIQERLPHIPEGEMASMYLPLTEDNTLPTYFAHPLA